MAKLPDNVRLKIRVNNPEHSKQIQEALFVMGYAWSGEFKSPHHTEKPYLFADAEYGEKCITYVNADASNFFEVSPYEEYTFIDGNFYKLGEEPKIEQPPIGLRPRKIASQERLVEILQAMLRYAEAGKYIPDAWDDEYDHLREYLNAVYSGEIASYPADEANSH